MTLQYLGMPNFVVTVVREGGRELHFHDSQPIVVIHQHIFELCYVRLIAAIYLEKILCSVAQEILLCSNVYEEMQLCSTAPHACDSSLTGKSCFPLL